MPRPRPIHIRPVLAGRTLVEALRQLLKDRTWTDIRRLIASRRVRVNGNACTDESRRLRTDDVLHVLDNPEPRTPDAGDIAIVWCDEHLLVCDKPPGINSVRHEDERNTKQPALDELLQSMHSSGAIEIPKSRPDGSILRRGRSRVRPVHRLDRDTSGLMIFALRPEAEEALSDAFRVHSIEREYLAVVHGDPGERSIETHLVRDRGDGLRGSVAVPPPESAQRAVTHVATVERIGRYSVVRCRLETGRTHQIRIHLAEIGHMVCGERTYVRPAPNAPAVIDRSKAPRLALHSWKLGLRHPVTGREIRLESDWPDDLSRWLGRLRAEGSSSCRKVDENKESARRQRPRR